MALSNVDQQKSTLPLASMTMRSQAICVLSDEGISIREITAMVSLSESHIARLATKKVTEWDQPEITRIVEIAWTSPKGSSADEHVRGEHSTADGAGRP